jgi:serine/threonine protein kinase
MIPDKWAQVKEGFHAAAELPPAKRAAFVRQHCNGDAEILRELQLLLESHDEAEHFIEKPALVSASDILPKGSDESWSDRVIGHYRVLREIGRGGMGVLLLAVRDDDQYKKSVAIKLLRRGMDTEDILRRFRNERQILASLEHPYIARLIDGGMTEDGLPYFVLEYIEGEPLDAYCDQHKLSTNQRLELFRKVCAAVQYAHQNLIVHRDLKPSNILVTSEGEPKLLDFGIAKLLNPELAAYAMAPTATQLRLMTPDYASPEQIRGKTITTASDIYSLGVLLYRLLTGHPPYYFADRSPQEIERLVCDTEPERPSTAVGRAEALATGKGPTRPTPVSKSRNDQPDALRRRLQGDLDNVVLMAMRKEPERRYQSPAHLAEDLRRYMGGLPVTARRNTFSYRASKFINRNRIGVAAACLILFTLLGAIVATTWQAGKAREQARIANAKSAEAQQALARTEKINKFLQSVFSYANPDWFGRAGGNPDMSAMDVMRDAEKRVDTEFANEPEIRADLHQQIGDTYRTQRLLADAERNLREALRLRLELYGDDNARVAESLYILSGVRMLQGDDVEQQSLLKRALDIQRRHPNDGNNLPYMMVDYAALITIHRGDFAEALALDLEALSQFQQRYGDNHYMIAATHGVLARDYLYLGDYQRAEVEIQEASKRTQQSTFFVGLPILISVQIERGDLQGAEVTIKQALAKENAKALTPADLAVVYGSRSLLAYRMGHYAQARADAEKFLSASGTGDYTHFSLTYDLALSLNKLGQAKRAESLVRTWMDSLKTSRFKDNPVAVAILSSVLGESLMAEHRFAEAETLLLSAYEVQKARVLPQEHGFMETRQRLAELYRAWGKVDEAKQYE